MPYGQSVGNWSRRAADVEGVGVESVPGNRCLGLGGRCDRGSATLIAIGMSSVRSWYASADVRQSVGVRRADGDLDQIRVSLESRMGVDASGNAVNIAAISHLIQVAIRDPRAARVGMSEDVANWLSLSPDMYESCSQIDIIWLHIHTEGGKKYPRHALLNRAGGEERKHIPGHMVISNGGIQASMADPPGNRVDGTTASRSRLAGNWKYRVSMLSPHVVELEVQEPYKPLAPVRRRHHCTVDLSDSAAIGGVFSAWTDQDFWRSAHIVADSRRSGVGRWR